MYTLIIILTVLVSILLIIVVLVQKSKGGGLSSAFAGSNQIMGVRRTNDFIEKATWTLAGIICVLSIISVFVMPRNLVQSGARVKPVNEVQTVNGTEYATPAPVVAPTATEEAPAAAEETATEENNAE
ncbi:MAG: preprotein translocase subunit SecG [Bacteroidales bacterium]|nr:preprotein translocase subunit SecG [Bacteroidales bacterium]